MSALIKTLIPAVRADFLESVLIGLSNQSLKDFDILIADDSPNKIITQMFLDGPLAIYKKTLKIEVCKGAGSELGNHNLLFNLWGGSTEYAHIHHDDDIIFPDFYRQHVTAHENMKVLMTVSSRWLTKRDGIPHYFSGLPGQLEQSNDHYVILTPGFVAGSTLSSCRNWLGEFTNVVMSKKLLTVVSQLKDYGDGPYGGILDMNLYLRVAAAGCDIGYIRDHLGAYRLPPPEAHYRSPQTKGGQIHRAWWLASAVEAWQGALITDAVLNKAVNVFVDRYLTEQPDNPIYIRLSKMVRSENVDLHEVAKIIKEAYGEMLKSQKSGVLI